MKPAQILRGLFKDSGRQVFLICLGCVIIGGVHVVSDVDFGCCLFLKFSRTDISENLKSLAHGPVLLADLDGPRRIQAEQEDDQNENDRCEAHGLFVQR